MQTKLCPIHYIFIISFFFIFNNKFKFVEFRRNKYPGKPGNNTKPGKPGNNTKPGKPKPITIQPIKPYDNEIYNSQGMTM